MKYVQGAPPESDCDQPQGRKALHHQVLEMTSAQTEARTVELHSQEISAMITGSAHLSLKYALDSPCLLYRDDHTHLGLESSLRTAGAMHDIADAQCRQAAHDEGGEASSSKGGCSGHGDMADSRPQELPSLLEEIQNLQAW